MFSSFQGFLSPWCRAAMGEQTCDGISVIAGTFKKAGLSNQERYAITNVSSLNGSGEIFGLGFFEASM